jgi:hypothetical protein
MYIYIKSKTMSEDIRKMIDKVKNFKQPINENLENSAKAPAPIGLENGEPEGINGLNLIFSPLEEDMIDAWNNDNTIKKLVLQKRIFLSTISYDKWGIWGVEGDKKVHNYIIKKYSW